MISSKSPQSSSTVIRHQTYFNAFFELHTKSGFEMTEKCKILSLRSGWTKLSVAYFLFFLLAHRDVCVLGFVLWAPLLAVRSTTQTTTNLHDAMDKFPTALNMPMPLKNMTRAFSSGTSFSSSFITPERLDELQQTIDIVSVMESYGLPRFSRSGQFRASCLCPFHDDRNPSLSIDGVRGIYKCFSCGAGGNIFSFVREYSKIQGDELSFSEAVMFVESQFASGDSSMILEPGTKNEMQTYNGNRTAYNATSGMKASAKGPRGFQASRNRIFMVNAAAAAFYGQCLGFAYAGRARSHLRARGMQPRTIRAFSMGYAPDAYFSQQGTWGEGSLVDYLQRKGFTTTEIVDAGLATVLKKDAMKIEIQQEKDKNFQIPYSSLMDRFRGRLMVPIFDASGVHVLGFGGRVLEEGFTSESESVSGPKYLNSPESPVFQKKNILFGHHMATMALRFWDKQEHIARAVVVVEGYMDAIALWQYGVREAVACMGTALTEEQITAAAILAGDKNGRVIFCLDNDDAGIAAVDRICRSGILATVSASHPVEFRVASLPDKVKDPAEYMDLHKGDSKPDEAFRLEVLESNSLHWMDWFQHRTLTQYNSTATTGEKWSFSDIMDRMGALLSMIKNSGERKARFDDIVDILLSTLAKDNEQGGVSEAVRLQIESELERKISMMSRTTKSVSDGALAKIERSSDEWSKTLARVAPASGDLPHSSILPRVSKPIKGNRRGRQRSSAELGPFQAKSSNSNIEGDIPPRRRFRSKDMSKQKASLTPHFSGFRFQNKHDAAWFGDDDFTGKRRYNSKLGKNDDGKFVYFNSNEYHGEQFLSDEARSAGYINTFVPRDPDLLTKGINSMIETTTGQLLMLAENDLLRTLLYFPSARSSLHRIMSIGQSVGSQDAISWSSPEKAWLFDRLTKENGALEGFDSTNLPDFHRFLASERTFLEGSLSNMTSRLICAKESLDVAEATLMEPTGCFQPLLSARLPEDTHNKTTSPRSDNNELEGERGALDYLFMDPVEENNPLFLSAEHAALRVQECYYTMVWSAAVQTLNRKQQQWVTGASKIHGDLRPDDRAEELFENGESSMQKKHTNTILHHQDSEALGIEIQQASEQVRLLSGVLRSLSSRLVQKAMPQSLSETWKEDYVNLSSRLETHMGELDQWLVHEYENQPIKDSEAYETILEQAQELWGELYDDEHFWSPADVVESRAVSSSGHKIIVGSGDREEVSLEEFSTRLDNEWGWLDDPQPEVAHREMRNLYEFNEEAWDEFLLNGSHDRLEKITTPLDVIDDYGGQGGSDTIFNK